MPCLFIEAVANYGLGTENEHNVLPVCWLSAVLNVRAKDIKGYPKEPKTFGQHIKKRRIDRKEILHSKLLMAERKLQIEGEVIHVIVKHCQLQGHSKSVRFSDVFTINCILVY